MNSTRKLLPLLARVLIPLALLTGPALAGIVGVPRVQGIPGGDSLQPDITAAASVSAACSDANINSCGANQTVAVAMAGAQGFGFIVPAASTLVSTLKVDCSLDNGTTWVNQSLLDSGGNPTASLVTATSTTYSSSASVPGGARQCRIRAALFTSGSATITVIATAAASVGNVVQGSATGTPLPTVVNDTTASGTLSTACSTGASCAGTAVLSIAAQGQQTFSLNITSIASPVGFTVVADCSYDGGTTWQLTGSPSTLGVLWFETAATTFLQSIPNGSITAGAGWSINQLCEGASHLRIRASAITSGTFTAQLRATGKWSSDPAYAGAPAANGTPPVVVALGAQDAVTATTQNAVQSAGNNTTPAAAKFLLTLNGFFRSAVQAGTAGNVAAASYDSTNGFLNIRVGDAATYTGANVTANAGTIGNGLQALTAVARASTTADTVTTSQYLQVSSVTGALFIGITGAAAGGTPADVLATNTATGSGLALLVNPGLGRSAVSAVTAGRVAAQAIDTVTGMQLMNLSDGASFLKLSVMANDNTAFLNGINALPAIARATPTAVTAARAEALQVDTASGGVYNVPVPTTDSIGLTQTVVSVNTTTNVKASQGNVYGVSCTNANASACYLQFYNNGGSPTCGTSVVYSIALPTSGTVNMMMDIPMATLSSGIAVCMGTTATGATACTTANSCTIFYK